MSLDPLNEAEECENKRRSKINKLARIYAQKISNSEVDGRFGKPSLRVMLDGIEADEYYKNKKYQIGKERAEKEVGPSKYSLHEEDTRSYEEKMDDYWNWMRTGGH